MIFREATVQDIPQLQRVRNSVHENILSDPSLVTDADCMYYLTKRGKGWVCDTDGHIVGFAIADVMGHNIWALFVQPESEQKGIGRQLHNLMMDWYFDQTKVTVWLSTAFDTRAENFYRKAGWQEVGMYNTKEIKFEMTFERWKESRGNNL